MEGQQFGKGWLLTCDQHKQKQALKDAYNFLTQYIEEQYDDLVAEAIQKKLKQQNVQLSLETELKQAKKKQNRLLFSVETNVRCVIFVKLNPKFSQVDPVLIVDKMMEDVHIRNKDITRYCHKILPVERAFKAEHFKMLDVVEQLFEQKTKPGEIKSWSLNFKLRNNSKFNYKQVLRQCQKIASKYGHFADIYYPQWTLSIEIANHLMCICLSDKFKEYKEYKLHKKVPGEPRHKRQLREESQADKVEDKEEEENGLMTEKELRERLGKPKNEEINQKKQVLNDRNDQEQNIKVQNINKAQSKQLTPNKKLLSQKIVANQEQDDVDLF